MLKQAFNALVALHSRPAYLKRLGTPDLYSPIRITPSNYFRFLEGPSSTTIHGREFVIPVDTVTGTKTQVLKFSIVPTDGQFLLTYDAVSTPDLAFNASAADIQTALRGITALASVTVAGNYTDGFTITMYGIQTPLAINATKTSGDELDADMTVTWGAGVKPSPLVKRTDKIIHDLYGHLAIDEVIEMVDLGGAVMAYRVRTD